MSEQRPTSATVIAPPASLQERLSIDSTAISISSHSTTMSAAPALAAPQPVAGPPVTRRSYPFHSFFIHIPFILLISLFFHGYFWISFEVTSLNRLATLGGVATGIAGALLFIGQLIARRKGKRTYEASLCHNTFRVLVFCEATIFIYHGPIRATNSISTSLVAAVSLFIEMSVLVFAIFIVDCTFRRALEHAANRDPDRRDGILGSSESLNGSSWIKHFFESIRLPWFRTGSDQPESSQIEMDRILPLGRHKNWFSYLPPTYSGLQTADNVTSDSDSESDEKASLLV